MGNPILYQHGGIVIPIGQGVTVRFVRKWDQMSTQEHAKLIQDALVRQHYLSQADKEKEPGDIGPLTREALVDFEVDRDLSPTQFDKPYPRGSEECAWQELQTAMTEGDKGNANPWVQEARTKGQPPAGSPGNMDVPPEWNQAEAAKKLPDPEYYFGFIRDADDELARLKRKRFIKWREKFAPLENAAQRGQFRQTLLDKLRLSGPDTVGAVDMPGWVKLTTKPTNPMPKSWEGVHPLGHHDDPVPGKSDPLNGFRMDVQTVDVFGPMVDFTVSNKFMAPGFGGCVTVQMIGTDWLFVFGHLCEISQAVWDHAQSVQQKDPLPAGTYLGSCGTWIGRTTGPHCHIDVFGRAKSATGDEFIARIKRKHWEPLLTDKRAHARFASIKQAALAEMKADAKAEAEKLMEELNLQEVFEKLLSEPPIVPVSDPPGEDQSDPAPL